MASRATGKMQAAGCAALAVAALSGLAAIRGRAQNNIVAGAMPRYVWQGSEAVVVGQPQVVSDGHTTLAAWSSDGRHVVAVRETTAQKQPVWLTNEPPATEINVGLWTTSTPRTLTLWRHRATPLNKSFSIDQLPGSPNTIVSLSWTEHAAQPGEPAAAHGKDERHQTLLFVDAVRQQVRELSTQLDVDLHVASGKPLAALHDEDSSTVRVMDRNGIFGPVMNVPRHAGGTYVDWADDSSALLLRWDEPAEAAGKRPVNRIARMDPATGVVTPLDKAPKAAPNAPEPPDGLYHGPLRVQQVGQTLRAGGVQARAQALWLSGAAPKPMQALVCADGAAPVISPRGDAVLYLSQGAAWVTPLIRVARQPFLEATRRLAMQNAKQIGVGLMMYVQDYDEIFSTSGENTANVINPYIKNSDVLDGLNYTYGGGALANIGKPAETVIGSYPAPGGTVVIYADGHVKWQDD